MKLFKNNILTCKQSNTALWIVVLMGAAFLFISCSTSQSPKRDANAKDENTTSQEDDETSSQADKPAMITGSWLSDVTCAPIDPDNSESWGCYYTDENGMRPIKMEAEWKITIVGPDGKTYEITDLSAAPEGSAWHVLFQVPAELKDKDFTVKGEVKLIGTPTNPSCPVGYILVPADSFYNTPEFCVMKYEAKQRSKDGKIVIYTDVGGSFAKAYTFDKAKEACANIGERYSLISNNEWMAIATNIASTDQNWSGGKVGVGALNQGNSDGFPDISGLNAELDTKPCFGTFNDNCQDPNHSDWSQKRTHTLSNGDVIWDISGNTKELVDIGKEISVALSPGDYSGVDSVTQDSKDMKITDLRPTHATHSWWNDSWGIAQGVGAYLAVYSHTVAMRGCTTTTKAGVFCLQLADNDPEDISIGFRCVYHK